MQKNTPPDSDFYGYRKITFQERVAAQPARLGDTYWRDGRWFQQGRDPLWHPDVGAVYRRPLPLGNAPGAAPIWRLVQWQERLHKDDEWTDDGVKWGRLVPFCGNYTVAEAVTQNPSGLRAIRRRAAADSEAAPAAPCGIKHDMPFAVSYPSDHSITPPAGPGPCPAWNVYGVKCCLCKGHHGDHLTAAGNRFTNQGGEEHRAADNASFACCPKCGGPRQCHVCDPATKPSSQPGSEDADLKWFLETVERLSGRREMPCWIYDSVVKPTAMLALARGRADAGVCGLCLEPLKCRKCDPEQSENGPGSAASERASQLFYACCRREFQKRGWDTTLLPLDFTVAQLCDWITALAPEPKACGEWVLTKDKTPPLELLDQNLNVIMAGGSDGCFCGYAVRDTPVLFRAWLRPFPKPAPPPIPAPEPCCDEWDADLDKEYGPFKFCPDCGKPRPAATHRPAAKPPEPPLNAPQASLGINPGGVAREEQL